MTDEKRIPTFSELLEGSPSNWGRWGPDDEVGALNYLDAAEALRGAAAIRSGRSFTLANRLGDPAGDPVWPGRRPAQRVNTLDHSHFAAGKGPNLPGKAEYADDMIVMYLQGTTQYDALGHVWYDDKLYNGYAAETTVGGLSHASVLPIAERGVVGRGILIDMARARGKQSLEPGETFDHNDLMGVAAAQGITIEKHDILVIRTGWIPSFYRNGATQFYSDFREPGLAYTPELVDWFLEREIPNLATDTIANESTVHSSGVALPLHCALMRNLGVVFTELLALDALADDCAKDGQFTFLYTAAPLKVVAGTGAPVNPIALK